MLLQLNDKTTIDFSDKNFRPINERIRQRSYILIFLHVPGPNQNPRNIRSFFDYCFRAFGTMDTCKRLRHALVYMPVTGNIDIVDLVAVFVEVVNKEEYEGISC